MFDNFATSRFLTAIPAEALASVCSGLILALAIWAVNRLKGSPDGGGHYQFWRLTIRNVAIAVFVLSLCVIWRKELQSVVVALGAAAAGCIIGFKEQWQSLMAFWVRVVKNTYNLNDFIEVEGIRGKVLDITWLTTAVAETRHDKDPLSFTGKVVHIPNHKLLNSNLIVANLTGAFSVHTVEVTLPKGADILKAKGVMLAAATAACARYMEAASRHMRELRQKEGLDTPDAAPRVRLHVGHEGVTTLLVRIVVPFTKRSRVEQDIIERFLANADAEAWPRIVLK